MNNKNKVGTVSETNLIEDVDNEVKNSSQNNKSKSYIKILKFHLKKKIRYIKKRFKKFCFY